MGMIDAKRRTNLKYLKYQVPTKPSQRIINAAMKSIRTNRTLDKKLISASSSPILDRGILEFIYALVSFPVYSTIPSINPGEASTVFAHRVFSRASGSIC